jgi:divalent metal cation (Fe/Co/Zn/Cd) transporter
VEDIRVAVGVLVLAIGLEGFSLRTAIGESRHSKAPDESWWGFIRSSRTPELPVVLLEDVGAITGLLLALVAVVLAAVTGNEAFDALGTIAIGVLLLVIAIVLMVEMKGLLIGEPVRPGEEQAIREALTTPAGVRSVIHLRTQHLGPDDVLVAAKIEIAPNSSIAEVADLIDEAEVAVRAVVPSARLIYLEPDLRKATTST